MNNEGTSTGKFLKLGNQFKKEGKLDEAIALYRQAINLCPSFAWYYYELGGVLAKKGLLEEAIFEYCKAVKINSESSFFCHELGKILQSKGELNRAINYYRRAIENQPNLAILYRSLGDALFQKENYSEAIINFLTALEIDYSPNTDGKLKKTYLKLGCTETGADLLLSRIKESNQQKTFKCRKTEAPDKFQQELLKPKVFGIGLGKTGTTTLGACLNHLNYKHYGWSSLTNYKLIYQIKLGDFDDVYRVVNQYDSFEDYPWPFIYKLLDEKYPNSKFILTIRKCYQIWLKSCLNHYLRLQERAAYVYKLIYGLDHPQDFSDDYVKFYETHNQEVIDYFKFKSDKLLIVCWEEGDSWAKLCGFLGKKVPNIPLPHLMKSKTS